MTAEGSSQIDNVMQESRLFPPTPEFVAKAKINSADAYQLWANILKKTN